MGESGVPICRKLFTLLFHLLLTLLTVGVSHQSERIDCLPENNQTKSTAFYRLHDETGKICLLAEFGIHITEIIPGGKVSEVIHLINGSADVVHSRCDDTAALLVVEGSVPFRWLLRFHFLKDVDVWYVNSLILELARWDNQSTLPVSEYIWTDHNNATSTDIQSKTLTAVNYHKWTTVDNGRSYQCDSDKWILRESNYTREKERTFAFCLTNIHVDPFVKAGDFGSAESCSFLLEQLYDQSDDVSLPVGCALALLCLAVMTIFFIGLRRKRSTV